ncbi:hypothetical protein KQI84_07460 [bacterium]|nr:hypothetical protein [bacterium]
MRHSAWMLVSMLLLWGCTVSAFGSEPTSSDEATTMSTLRITAEVPEGLGPVFLAGSLKVLGPWNPRFFEMTGKGTQREAVLEVPTGTQVEFKFTLGDWGQEALDEQGNIPPNCVVVVDGDTDFEIEIPEFGSNEQPQPPEPLASEIPGKLMYWLNMESKYLKPDRHVAIWLPPSYETEPERRYPVLYMHDGQNVFEPRTSTAGVDWGADEKIAQLAGEGIMPEMIVVASFCTYDRMNEYSPYALGPLYAKFMVEELKPRVDAEFRTLPDREHTAVMGSSMGGLISLYIGWKHSDTFSAAGCLSTHYPWENGLIIQEIQESGYYPTDVKLYFDYGTEGIDSEYAAYQAKMTALLESWGWTQPEDFMVYVAEGANHSEADWRARLQIPLTYLFGELPKDK